MTWCPLFLVLQLWYEKGRFLPGLVCIVFQILLAINDYTFPWIWENFCYNFILFIFVPLLWSFYCFVPMIYKFDLLLVSHRLYMFCLYFLIPLSLPVSECSSSSILSYIPDIVSSTWSILVLRLLSKDFYFT